jgi:hypothetical protein
VRAGGEPEPSQSDPVATLCMSEAFQKSPVFGYAIHMMDVSRPDLNLLLALEALLAERNVTRAAARLNLSQPALSAQLRRLREIFGDPLLVPARRGGIPTQRALELQAPLREALKALRYVVAGRQQFDPSTAEFAVAIAASDYGQCALARTYSRDSARSSEAPPFLETIVRTGISGADGAGRGGFGGDDAEHRS